MTPPTGAARAVATPENTTMAAAIKQCLLDMGATSLRASRRFPASGVATDTRSQAEDPPQNYRERTQRLPRAVDQDCVMVVLRQRSRAALHDL